LKSQNMGAIYIALAGLSWSTTGIFAKNLMASGISSQEVALLRLTLGTIILFCILMLQNRAYVKIDRKGLVLTFFMGTITQGLFNLCFFSSVDAIGVMNATILLYLAPLFITGFSVLLFKEKLTALKKWGVFISVVGSTLALTGGRLDLDGLTFTGILLGVLSGLGYSLVSVFSKFGLKKYMPQTMILYSFLFGALLIAPFSSPHLILQKLNSPIVVLSTMGLGIFSASVAYLLYFAGINTGIELSKVGVISTIELIFAIIFSVIFAGEMINGIKIFGILLILCAIVLINLKTQAKAISNITGV